MKYIYYIKMYDVDGELNYDYILSSLDKEDFEKLLINLNIEIKKTEKFISNIDIYNELIKRLEKNNCELGIFYKNKYTLTDDCPLPNSTYFIKSEKKYENLK